MTRSGRGVYIAVVGLACVLSIGACTKQNDPGPTYSTLGVPGEMLCSFVPKADVVAAVGTTQFTTQGQLMGRHGHQPLTDSGCFVRSDPSNVPILEVTVEGRGSDGGFTDYLIKHPDAGMTVFPADHPYGVVNPSYTSKGDGSKGDVTRTGAVATAAIGDWYINLRIYRPGKGRNAVADATHLVQRVIDALQLPSQPTQTYAEFTPRNETASPQSPSGKPAR